MRHGDSRLVGIVRLRPWGLFETWRLARGFQDALGPAVPAIPGTTFVPVSHGCTALRRSFPSNGSHRKETITRGMRAVTLVARTRQCDIHTDTC
jgi:hypothetical protein